eukprot:scaffold2257_cov169-Amphora_coffeaeformis.AAC.10
MDLRIPPSDHEEEEQFGVNEDMRMEEEEESPEMDTTAVAVGTPPMQMRAHLFSTTMETATYPREEQESAAPNRTLEEQLLELCSRGPQSQAGDLMLFDPPRQLASAQCCHGRNGTPCRLWQWIVWGREAFDPTGRRKCATCGSPTTQRIAQGARVSRDLSGTTHAYRVPRTRGGEAAKSILQDLLQGGADINAVDANGQTALYVACEQVFVDTAVALLEDGANATVRSTQSQTALHVACRHHVMELVQRLVEKGWPDLLHAVDDHGWTALHIVCHDGHLELVQRLLQLGADAGQRSSLGTSFYQACLRGHAPVMHYSLQEHGAVTQLQGHSR